MTLQEEFDRAVEIDRLELKSDTVEFFGDVIDGTPVDDGYLKDDWQMDINQKWTWSIVNNMEYAPIIAEGRQLINGVWYGSTQGWGLEGLDFLIDNFIKELDDKF